MYPTGAFTVAPPARESSFPGVTFAGPWPTPDGAAARAYLPDGRCLVVVLPDGASASLYSGSRRRPDNVVAVLRDSVRFALRHS